MKDAELEAFETITVGNGIKIQSMGLSSALPLYEHRQVKVILQHDNSRPYVAKPIKIYREMLKREVYPFVICPRNCAILAQTMPAHGLANQQFHSYESIIKWLDSRISSKDEHFVGVFDLCQKDGEKL